MLSPVYSHYNRIAPSMICRRLLLSTRCPERSISIWDFPGEMCPPCLGEQSRSPDNTFAGSLGPSVQCPCLRNGTGLAPHYKVPRGCPRAHLFRVIDFVISLNRYFHSIVSTSNLNRKRKLACRQDHLRSASIKTLPDAGPTFSASVRNGISLFRRGVQRDRTDSEMSQMTVLSDNQELSSHLFSSFTRSLDPLCDVSDLCERSLT